MEQANLLVNYTFGSNYYCAAAYCVGGVGYVLQSAGQIE